MRTLILMAFLGPLILFPHNPSAQPRVQILTDQMAGTVTITIDGQPALRVSGTGLEISGSLSYGGLLQRSPFEVSHAH